ncbi:MAG: hypothetical protein ACI3ZO_05940 [Candidatus Cryptobacteroides sp.]|nr:hypothetical protein [Bacteroidales bacterium]
MNKKFYVPPVAERCEVHLENSLMATSQVVEKISEKEVEITVKEYDSFENQVSFD